MTSIFGLAEKALTLCEHRAGILSNNVANASTPNYKARDIDFKQALTQVSSSHRLVATQPGHVQFAAQNQVAQQPLKYRVPSQHRMDKNTVDEEIERKNFMENTVNYQANLTFVKAQYSQLMKAIRGD